jgi:Spy/CpxP family protein refolding chaperone
MKMNKFTLLAILALGGLTAFGTLAQAQDSTNTPPSGARQRPPGGPGARMGKLAQDLGLSEDQKEKFGPILKEQAEQMKALREDTSLTQEDKKAKMKTLREATAEKIKGILTPEQFTKFQELQKQRRGPGGMGGPGGKPPGDGAPATPPPVNN